MTLLRRVHSHDHRETLILRSPSPPFSLVSDRQFPKCASFGFHIYSHSYFLCDKVSESHRVWVTGGRKGCAAEGSKDNEVNTLIVKYQPSFCPSPDSQTAYTFVSETPWNIPFQTFRENPESPDAPLPVCTCRSSLPLTCASHRHWLASMKAQCAQSQQSRCSSTKHFYAQTMDFFKWKTAVASPTHLTSYNLWVEHRHIQLLTPPPPPLPNGSFLC